MKGSSVACLATASLSVRLERFVPACAIKPVQLVVAALGRFAQHPRRHDL